MKHLIALAFLLGSLFASAQNTIYSHAIGNWRNGPTVYITPLIETTEAFTTPQLIARYRAEYPELKDVVDLDVLRFGTPEEGDESRRVLQAKYGVRKLPVVMLEQPSERPGPTPTDQH